MWSRPGILSTCLGSEPNRPHRPGCVVAINHLPTPCVRVLIQLLSNVRIIVLLPVLLSSNRYCRLRRLTVWRALLWLDWRSTEAFLHAEWAEWQFKAFKDLLLFRLYVWLPFSVGRTQCTAHTNVKCSTSGAFWIIGRDWPCNMPVSRVRFCLSNPASLFRSASFCLLQGLQQ